MEYGGMELTTTAHPEGFGAKKLQTMKEYIFFRREGWYIDKFKSNNEARKSAMINPETILVKDKQGNTIYKAKTKAK